ncbi:hypothetical protein B0H12DRAFT_813212 [Mycena haematopus]|nr:hypothetical protein B0H12DRAFT_813212 [Mycena haematopus]
MRSSQMSLPDAGAMCFYVIVTLIGFPFFFCACCPLRWLTFTYEDARTITRVSASGLYPTQYVSLSLHLSPIVRSSR